MESNTGLYREYEFTSHITPSFYQRARAIGRLLKEHGGNVRTVLDAGCGTGFLCGYLAQEGYETYGLDLSKSGIRLAGEHYPELRFATASVYDDYTQLFEGVPSFDAIVSTEVIEHLYDPRAFVGRIYQALNPGGTIILTTPYHGYLKCLLLAITGKLDHHFSALWDGGHIKFWSYATLTELLREAGFVDFGFQGIGRAPYLWKSMVLVARRPMGPQTHDA